MRRGFEMAMRQYTKEMAMAEKAASKSDDQELKKANDLLEYSLRERAEASASSLETQQEILEIQKEKMKIFKKMRRDFRALDAGTLEKEAGLETMSYDKTSQMFVGKSKDGKEYFLTRGELFGNVEWDVFCNLDESVPRNIRKEYILARARKEIRDLLDVQILAEETKNKRSNPSRRDAYIRTQESLKNNDLVSGWIAETMVRGLLSRLAIDFNLAFEVDRADIFMDVDHKVDFVLRRPRYHRGVGIDRNEGGVDENEKDFDDDANNGWGVQFTTSSAWFDLSRKRRQMLYARQFLPENKLKDLVLVSIPLPRIVKRYERWKRDFEETGVSFGGPEQYWSTKVQLELIDGLLTKFWPPEHIDALKQMVLRKENERLTRLGKIVDIGTPAMGGGQTEIEQETHEESKELNFIADYEKLVAESPEITKQHASVLKKIAKRTQTSFETQLAVYNLVRKKLEVVKKIEEAILVLMAEGGEGKKKRIKYDQENDIFFREFGQKRSLMTRGEIIASLEWDLPLAFDRASVPEDLLKEVGDFWKKRAEKRFDDLIIATMEVGRKDAEAETKKVYQDELAKRESVDNPEILKKKTLLSFFRKLSIDFDLGFTVEEADLRTKVKEGVDIVLKFEQRELKIKTSGLTLPENISVNLNEWKTSAKIYGISAGPDLFWSPEAQIKIVKEVFGEIFPADLIEDIFKALQNRSGFIQKI